MFNFAAAKIGRKMNKHEYKAALFDLDGVVFDTEPQYTEFWGRQGKEFHPEMPDFAQRIKGQTLTQIYEGYFSGKLVCVRDRITARLDRFERQMDFQYVNGFEDFVWSLRAQGIKTAVVTSSNKNKMRSVYDKHPEFIHYFDAILTSEDFAYSKPDPDCYLKAAARFGLAPADCMVFEDSFNGLRSGCAAGMTVIGLSTTNSPEAIQPLCSLVVPDYRQEELLNMFK